jgi:hypothetical protein
MISLHTKGPTTRDIANRVLSANNIGLDSCSKKVILERQFPDGSTLHAQLENRDTLTLNFDSKTPGTFGFMLHEWQLNGKPEMMIVYHVLKDGEKQADVFPYSEAMVDDERSQYHVLLNLMKKAYSLILRRTEELLNERQEPAKA